jgi:hypothetical protein
MTTPAHINPVQWQQNVGYARAACARIFRDGGKASDALTAFGLPADHVACWSTVVDRIAAHLAAPAARRLAA